MKNEVVTFTDMKNEVVTFTDGETRSILNAIFSELFSLTENRERLRIKIDEKRKSLMNGEDYFLKMSTSIEHTRNLYDKIAKANNLPTIDEDEPMMEAEIQLHIEREEREKAKAKEEKPF